MSGGRLPAAPRAHSTQAKPPRRRDEHTAALASPGARSTITYEGPRRALAGLPHLAAAATQSKESTRADIRVSQPTQPSVSLAVAVPPQCDRLCRIFTGAPAHRIRPPSAFEHSAAYKELLRPEFGGSREPTRPHPMKPAALQTLHALESRARRSVVSCTVDLHGGSRAESRTPMSIRLGRSAHRALPSNCYLHDGSD